MASFCKPCIIAGVQADSQDYLIWINDLLKVCLDLLVGGDRAGFMKDGGGVL